MAALGEETVRDEDELAHARVVVAPRLEAVLALVPLGVIVLGLITPPILPHALYRYPARVVPVSLLEDGFSAMWSIPLTALLLSAMTATYARRRSEPGLAGRVLALIGILATLHLPAVMLYVLRGEAPALSAANALVLVAALVLAVVGVRRPGWRGWMVVLAAYAVAALPYACPLFPGIFNMFSGGVTFAVADVTLLALCVRSLRR